MTAAMEIGSEPPASTWALGSYVFEFRKGASGVSILTVKVPSRPLPFHMVVKSQRDARQKAPGVVSQFETGGIPEEGVFRRMAKGASGRIAALCEERSETRYLIRTMIRRG